MSLMKTFARVAAGVMLAKGIGTVMKQRQQGGQGSRSGQVGQQQGERRGGLLDGLLSNNTSGTGGGSLSDMLGGVLGGGSRGAGSGRRYGGEHSTGASGGLGGILDNLTNRARGSGGGSGGLGDLLGQLSGGRKSTGGSTSGSGGLGDLLGGLLGGAAGGAAAGGLARKDSQATNDASFGELFNDAVTNNGEPEVAPTPEQNAVAGLMLRAMIQAAKSDGKIDDEEKQRLMGHLGDDIDEEERQFIREQMAAPVDAAGLAREVPKGLESQVYLVSLLAIDLDSEAEARYLNDLAQAMGIDRETVNGIHGEAGVTPLYS
ncbi:tellurite resistance TerB family protein [Paracoccus caeni]|uniref:Tellurite resistance TerB family protein n=1 Tax=Paracoccus caeni TaxID=657651 RepID=A0A934SDF1_9RHOB|nr:tellurite resistance TerB family protein [Paracoccus caeni]MBK4214886.1 tellurite resistance TerB family protein [Paracoccus caeni]